MRVTTTTSPTHLSPINLILPAPCHAVHQLTTAAVVGTGFHKKLLTWVMFLVQMVLMGRHTAGPAQAINMDDIIDLAVGTFRCPTDLQNKAKNVVTFLDRVVWTTEKHKALRDTCRLTAPARS